jgi:hypothetical protein
MMLIEYIEKKLFFSTERIYSWLELDRTEDPKMASF